MIIESCAGAYCLLAAGPRSSDPLAPAGVSGVSITSALDCALITTSGQDDLRVDVTILNSPFRQSGPFGWEVRKTAEFDVSGPIFLTDLEGGRDDDSEEIPLRAGRNFVEVHARSAEFVRDRPMLQIDGRAMEQHAVYLSPIAVGR